MNKEIKKIKQQIDNNPILLYMKGTPQSPKCGFSLKAAKILSNCIESFSYIDVLQDSDIRLFLPKFSNWPTFPQLWINKKLIGGCDIISELYHSGELIKLIRSVDHKKI